LTELGEFDFIATDAYKTPKGVWKWKRSGHDVPKTLNPTSFPGNGNCLGFDKNGDLSTFDCAKAKRIICET
jgi:hypothetical protein